MASFFGESLFADGPQNILVAVNADDPASLAIANEYVAIRNIPACNVVYLADIRKSPKNHGETTNATHYWQDIGKPIRTAMQERGLVDQIDCIAYSSGFPTRVSCNWEKKRYLKYRNVAKASLVWHPSVVSLNGITFFGKEFFSKQPTFMDRHANWYCGNTEDTRAFSSGTVWTEQGSIDELGQSGKRFMLSTVLAVVRPDASTVVQGVAQLRTSAKADSTFPDGLFYFADHKDVRSKTRKSGFASAANALTKMGKTVEIGSDKMPVSKKVIGAVLGSPFIKWKDSKSEFLPGALCDNFTSYGACWTQKQTKVTHFLNSGAAAATGMVTEPYTVPSKIPTPFAQVHYARGCTVAEAIYQTVQNPFQLLVVGDPLCAPFAAKPEFTVSGFENGAVVSEELNLMPSPTSDGTIEKFEIFVDGRLGKSSPTGQSIALKIDELGDGYHELRIAATSNTVSKSVHTKTYDFFVRKTPEDLGLVFKTDKAEYSLDENVRVQCHYVGKQKVQLIQHYRVVGEFKESGQTISVKASDLGAGQSSLYACASLGDGQILSAPIKISIAHGN